MAPSPRLEKITPGTFYAAIALKVRLPDGLLRHGLRRGGPGKDLRSGLWRLNNAAGEQGHGYGRFAVEAVADEIRRRGGTRLTATWHPGGDGPGAFYFRLGFRLTGEMAEDECVGELDLA